MSDEECMVIESKAIGHLVRCGMDDFTLGVVDMTECLSIIWERFYD